jgi:cellulose/xylan binding protein with CBM9 domain
MASRLPLAIGIACALMLQSASAQPKAQIKKTNTAPVIDGNGNDAAWASANAYGTTTFFLEAQTTPLAVGNGDIELEWRGLWDNTNLYVMAKVTDDAIVNGFEEFGGLDSNNGWEDDAIEFYIDAQDLNNAEYRPDMNPGQPTFQFTSVAGWTPQRADTDPNSPRLNRDPNMLPNTAITWGVNSYDGNDADRHYPQTMGMATSGPITTNPAGGFDFTFEASFPWTALEETPADILARGGIFGLGVGYNDDDDRGSRDSHFFWEHNTDNMWFSSAPFPDVQLVDAPAPLQGDYNSNGTVDAADYVRWRDNPGAFGGDPAGFNTWRLNFGKTAAPASAISGAAASPEPATLVMFLLLTTPWVLRRKRL